MTVSDEKKYVIAIDQGTTSTRAIAFDHDGMPTGVAQREFTQIFPRAGWVEHDPEEIWRSVRVVVGELLGTTEINRHAVASVGITNQRETTIVWDKNTGEPVYNAIVWQDTRTAPFIRELSDDGGYDRFQKDTGLRLSPYFSASKIKWILDNVEGAREKAEKGDLLFGNPDTWVVWNLTGGVNGGVHVTDVSNASRTLLMDINTLEWREDLCDIYGIPMSMLPEIKSSSEIYGYGRKNSLLIDTPIAGILGDQQAATFAQACFSSGMAKNTYGTGCFMLMNTGDKPTFSENGLLTTVAYKLGDEPAQYALEGSIAVTGSLVQWLRDNLGIIETSPDVEKLANTVDDNGGVYFVPAFSGLFAPYWHEDARGAIVGMTRFNNAGHIARAALEATAFQTADVLSAMNKDSGVDLKELRVDGGMTANNALMQFQSDILGVEVIKPKVAETTALGAAYAAGLAVGFWESTDEITQNWQEDKRWTPDMSQEERDRQMRLWHKAVDRTLDWVDKDVEEAEEEVKKESEENGEH